MLSNVEVSWPEAPMGWGSIWRARLRFLRGREAVERDMDHEMRFHLESEIADEVARGTDPDEARRLAHLRFGGVERYKEEARDAHGIRPVIDLAHDMRYAVRVLRRDPAFAVAAILTRPRMNADGRPSPRNDSVSPGELA